MLQRFPSLAAIALVACLWAPAMATAQEGPPPPPHAFFGEVTIDGQPAPAGVVIESRADGIRTGIPGNPVTVAEPGRYGGPTAREVKLVAQGRVADGLALTFYINGRQALCAAPGGEWQDTFPFQSGGVTALNLRLGAAPTVPLPSPPPRGAASRSRGAGNSPCDTSCGSTGNGHGNAGGGDCGRKRRRGRSRRSPPAPPRDMRGARHRSMPPDTACAARHRRWRSTLRCDSHQCAAVARRRARCPFSAGTVRPAAGRRERGRGLACRTGRCCRTAGNAHPAAPGPGRLARPAHACRRIGLGLGQRTILGYSHAGRAEPYRRDRDRDGAVGRATAAGRLTGSDMDVGVSGRLV